MAYDDDLEVVHFQEQMNETEQKIMERNNNWVFTTSVSN